MTAADPNALDARRWMEKAHRWLHPSVPVPHRWTVEDLKIAWLLRDQFTRAELLSILEIASGKRYDNRAGIDTFLRMMAAYIDGLGGAE